jgi:hypothetical protein
MPGLMRDVIAAMPIASRSRALRDQVSARPRIAVDRKKSGRK